ncbi:MAG: hypothetical protein PHT42_06780, partial [Thermotogota bacterium]|nr:hypothetical protein [Thermotogota bacterium]
LPCFFSSFLFASGCLFAYYLLFKDRKSSEPFPFTGPSLLPYSFPYPSLQTSPILSYLPPFVNPFRVFYRVKYLLTPQNGIR